MNGCHALQWAELQSIEPVLARHEAGTRPLSADGYRFYQLRRRLINRSASGQHHMALKHCSYLLNISYFLYLRAHGGHTRQHPCVDRLLLLRQVWRVV